MKPLREQIIELLKKAFNAGEKYGTDNTREFYSDGDSYYSHALNFDQWFKSITLPDKEQHGPSEDRLKIICICGSTRFADIHAIKRWEFEKTGKYICLMINYLPEWYAKKEFGEGVNDHFGEAAGLKELLDTLHFRKIDIADEVYVVNYEGYIGESTRNEIEYALKLGKPVNYMKPLK